MTHLISAFGPITALREPPLPLSASPSQRVPSFKLAAYGQLSLSSLARRPLFSAAQQKAGVRGASARSRRQRQRRCW